MRALTPRQKDVLKVLKRAPKTTTQVAEQLQKKLGFANRNAVRSRLRGLENRELIRARTKYNKNLKRDVILWELTETGRDALI